MYKINEYVIHTTGGICQIKDIAPLEISGADKEKKYYLLVPVKNKNSKVFVPVGNEDSAMRPIISENEAWVIIDDIPNIGEIVVENEKFRETIYKEAIRSCDPRELVKIGKSLFSRRQQRIQEGKKTTATDDKYYKLAEDNLYSELAFVLGKQKEEIPDIISARIGGPLPL